ncbi:pyridoxal-5'-phosphate-dependent protein beta subunit [Cunninghamella echinulata]|nr:pyridoxal-5'-phosphate-dependent protein beta subunit [Cunninghamella echinulata]
MTHSPITIEDVQAAATRIKVHRTPVLSCSTVNNIASENNALPIELFFKCELFQKTGSFKYRGASNAVSLLRPKSTLTHSSGNHAQALAKAALDHNIPAYIVMPNNSPQVKKDAVRGYGATVIECEPTLEAREATAEKVMKETGSTLIHPFENSAVIAGQGTIALEFLAQISEQGTALDALIIPVGGGGMLSGCAVTAKSIASNILVFGAEPEIVNDTYRSYYSEKGNNKNKDEWTRQINNVGATSVADGLLTNVGKNTFPIIMQYVDGIYTVTEEQILQAMKLIWNRMKLCIEPSAATGVAVVLYNTEFHQMAKEKQIKKIGIVLCGGNVDIDRAAKLMSSV